VVVAVATAEHPAGVIAAQALRPQPIAGKSRRVSTANGGQQGNSDSSEAAISGDGRYVAFDSNASNLVPGDTNHATDIFVVDMKSHAIQRVSVGTSGRQALGGDLGSQSIEPAISLNGRYVAFTSSASTLVPADTNGRADIFVRDLRLNVTQRVSMGAGSTQGNGRSAGGSLSADGRYVAFTSWSDNLVARDGNRSSDVFVRDVRTNVTRLVSLDDNGLQGHLGSEEAQISADGGWVAFESFAPDLVPGDTNATSDVFVRDLAKQTTIRVSVGPDGAQTIGGSRQFGSVSPSISADGRKVAFSSFAAGLVVGDQLPRADAYVRDLASGKTQRVAVGPRGALGDLGGGISPALSSDGRYVTFASVAGNLVAGDTNAQFDIFVRDLLKQTTRRITAGTTGGANGWSGHPVPSARAAKVAYVSLASNLVVGDTNTAEDIFVH
jgi:Tol biopolymer transport system component